MYYNQQGRPFNNNHAMTPGPLPLRWAVTISVLSWLAVCLFVGVIIYFIRVLAS